MLRRDELKESLLSNRRLTYREDKFQDIDRLARKVTPSLPEVRREQHKVRSHPLLCPVIFSPQSRFIICWEVLNIFLIYVYFMEIPITIAFQNHRSEEENQRFFQMINFPAISIFICGMFINLNTSFYEDGLLRKEPVEIRRNYMKTSFLPDLISIVSILIYEIVELLKLESRQTLKFIVILCYLKVIELMKIERTIINSFDLNRRIKAALKLFLLLMKIFLICNIVACGAFYLSDSLSNPNHTPILKPDGSVCREECYWVLNTSYAGGSLKEVNSFNVQYIYSLYWASTTMISIGYGDITPKNPYEITYTIVIQFLSCLLYAYAINTIWSIIQQLNAKKYKIHSRLNIINLYMRDKAIGPELMSRINAYLNNYYYAKNLRERDIEAEIINELTPALKRELYYQSYSVIFSHRLFEGMSPDLIGGVSQYVREVGYYEDEMVFLKDFAISPCLYYVRKGELIHFTGGKTQVGLKNIYTRDFVGLYEFVTQISHESILKAVKYSLTYLLRYEDWRNILYRYSEDFEAFYQLKDEILLYDKLEKIGYRCYFCSSSFHPTDLCFDNHIRNELISDRSNRKREDQNLRKKYVRREFKMHFHEKQDKNKRKMTLRSSELKLYNRLDGHHTSLLHAGKPSAFEREDMRDSPRKSSFDCDVHEIRRGGRFFIRNNKSKAENHRAIDRIRKEYANRERDSDYSDEESLEEEIKAVEICMDILCNYDNYYTSFNVAEFNQRDQARRRMTRSFV